MSDPSERSPVANGAAAGAARVNTSTNKSARGAGGRFTKGGRGGPGNPARGKVERLRHALLKATSPAQAVRIWRKTMKMAEDGDVQAQRLFYERMFGKAEQPLLLGGGGAAGDAFRDELAAAAASDPVLLAMADAYMAHWARLRRAGPAN
jgi:hypothetical protein